MNLEEVYTQMNGDYADVMSRLPRPASIIKFLRRFKDNEEFNDMVKAAEDKDYKRVFELSHDLKGMTANLSITKLSSLTSEICEQTRNREPDEGFTELVGKAQAEYNTVIDAIDKLED